ncbi:Fic family protein [Candidatus Saganbacteria bacterium]|nr:Fic family protein [Candidatus Saganbacteria bacterium]
MITALAKYRPPTIDRRLEFAVRHRDLPLERKRVILGALERLDRLIDSMPDDFPFDERAQALLQNDLGFHSVGAMGSLIDHPDITEVEIGRVQAMNYGANPYGPEVELYRAFPAFRSNGNEPYWMPAPQEVPQKMKELIKWINSPAARILHPFLRAVMFYARYDQIHPFEGQTKHTARFFMDKILLQGERGRRYPPVLASRDFRSFLVINTPSEDRLLRFNSFALIRQGRTADLALQLLCLYVNNLDRVFYGDLAGRTLNEEMRGLVRLLNPETRDFFELNP